VRSNSATRDGAPTAPGAATLALQDFLVRSTSKPTAQARIDKVDVLRVAMDVGGGEGAGRDHGLAARPDVIEHPPDQRAPQSLALPSLVDLRVRDDHAVAGGPVFRPADQLAVDAQLEAALVRVVLDGPADGVTLAPAARTA
jgi:hypothetical protein